MMGYGPNGEFADDEDADNEVAAHAYIAGPGAAGAQDPEQLKFI